MTHGTLEAASSSLSFVCPSACPLSPHCRAKNLFLPLLLQPWVLLALCGQAIPSPQLPPPTPSAHIPWEKNDSPESCGNSLAGVMLRETVFLSWRASVSQQLCASPQGAGQRGALAASGKVLLVPGGLAEPVANLVPGAQP